ncbi:Rrf2 family transcriptional regulator [Brevundimonas sp.]|uniref:Rrf2 family transcriptional regulator n=1 Tax=Brevundimonas sp. TaxID=1871086 RepID=UPI003F6EBC12
MKRDSRLSGVLHALLHMSQAEAPMTSEQLAVCLHTNPVVVRRTMAGLREAGLVISERGHGGGWRLGRPLSGITLRDVHTALGEPALTPESPAVESPGCLVEAAVNRSLEDAYAEARALIEARLAHITLADLAADFADRMADFKAGAPHGPDHAA